MIYIASPYSHPDPGVRQLRFLEARRYANKLMLENRACFSPIAYGHQFAEVFNTPTDHNTWATLNESILVISTSMHVLMLEGWRESRGVSFELAFARRHSINIKYVEPFE